MRVLVIEDDAELAEAIAAGLRQERMAVDVAFDGTAGLERALVNSYDVIVLDRDLPGRPGDEVCAELIETGGRSRVLMLTAAATVEDRVDGLALGADDYLPKPFAFAELVARLRALLRRAQPSLTPVLAAGELRLDPARRMASRGGQLLDLGPKEFGVLELLLAAQGRVVSAEELLERVWDEMADPFSSAVKVTVSRLRRKLGDPPVIVTLAQAGDPDPPVSVRLRLTLLYVGLFLASAACLLTVTYFLVRQQLPQVSTSNGGVIAINGTGAGSAGSASGTCDPSQSPGLVQLGTCQQVLQAVAVQAGRDTLNQLLIWGGIALGIMALVSVGLGWLMAGRVLRPLRTITTAARRISARSLHQRIAMNGPDDELKELGDTFDQLLGRLEASFRAQRQFVANASHELRTPLARQRTLLEVALRDPEATAGSLRAASERALAANEQSERLIGALLTLARGERGLDRFEPVDLSALARPAGRAAVRRGRGRGDAGRPPRPGPGVRGSGAGRTAGRKPGRQRDQLQHGRRPGRSRHRHPAGGGYLAVTNTGPVIAPDQLGRLFQPFQRMGPARQGAGLGLGLAIVGAIAAAHGAQLRAVTRAEGGWPSRFSFPPRLAAQ